MGLFVFKQHAKISKPSSTYWLSENRPWAKCDPRAVVSWPLLLRIASYFSLKHRTNDITPWNVKCTILLLFPVLNPTAFLWTFYAN